MFARPFVRVDGREYALSRGGEQAIPVAADPHVVETFIRYRGTRAALGTGCLEVNVTSGQQLHIEATNGSPFTPRLGRD